MASDFKSIPPKLLIQTLNFLEKTLSFLSSLSSDPLFSTIITLHTLILIYFPSLFFKIVFSPILLTTGISLFFVLRLGSIQRNEPQLVEEHEFDQDSKPILADCFFKWNVKAPLEVIYEAYEGEEEEEESDVVSNRIPTLSVYYPESDTDCSSDDDWDLPERMWEEEDKDDLIEISLEDRGDKRNMDHYNYAAEEDNLIEINLFPTGIRYS